ncbi:MAG: aldehyde dehydrogenase family protein [Planctomycetota bacterium]
MALARGSNTEPLFTASADDGWVELSPKRRCRVVASVRHRLVEVADEFTRLLQDLPPRRHAAESLGAEVLPLAAAAKWIGRRGPRVLRVEHHGALGRPVWLWGVRSEVRRDPYGTVLVIGPGNFPLLLTGVQVMQALAAGNRVVVKPASGCRALTERFVALLRDAGVPAGCVVVTGEDPAELDAVYPNVDLVVLTGSEATGRAVQRRCAEHGVPSIMELSGCDAVFVLPGADVEQAAHCVAYGLTLNGSNTCIAPRRVFVDRSLQERFVAALGEQLAGEPASPVTPRTADLVDGLLEDATQRGGEVVRGGPATGGVMEATVVTGADASMDLMKTDVFAPLLAVCPTDSVDASLREAGRCGYRLGASVFGPRREAEALARRIDAGCVVINDVIVPTADPRLPFAGRGRSGYGATRGAEGLRQMTRVKAVAVRHRAVYPHLQPVTDATAPLLKSLLQFEHGRGLRGRLNAVRGLLKYGRAASRGGPDQEPPP